MKNGNGEFSATPPFSVEAEKAALGSMLHSPMEAIGEAGKKLEAKMFFVPAHQKMFTLMLEMAGAGQLVNLISFTQALRDRHLLDSIGGPGYVVEVQDFVPTGENIGYYLGTILDKYILREIIERAAEATRKAYQEQHDPLAVLEEYQAGADNIARLTRNDETAGALKDFVGPALKDLRTVYHNRGEPTGIATGFKDLDRIMNGFEAPLTYYFCARPAMGKSSIMLAFAEHIAINAAAQRKRIKIFSLEMTGKMLAKRLICSRADIELTKMRGPYAFMDKRAIDEHKGKREGFLPRADAAAAELMTDYVLIDEQPDLNILQFRLRARQAVSKDKCKLIMIDYLQRMKGCSKRSQMHRELEINEIAQGISATAKELNVPIVVLAQLNRKPEDRWDGRPELGDVRESGSVEQEARFVGLLWRPWYYAHDGDGDGDEKEEEEEGKKKKNRRSKKSQMLKMLKREFKKFHAEHDFDNPDVYREFAVCDVAKQNEGPVGPVVLRFVSEFARFEQEDPDRPLFSPKEEERQDKPHDKKKKPPPAPETNGEAGLDEVNKILAMAHENGFPNATTIEGAE
jgi:replicative DNA helicase